MKKLFTFILAVLLTATTFAQAPEKMSYQAVIRDGAGALVTNQVVGMQISILQTTATGTVVYKENQTPTTNVNGLVTLEIGTGTVLSGNFTTIDWSSGPSFIKTETDPTGGTSYTIAGTSQLLSVPYALQAKKAENGISTAQANEIAANTLKVGYTDALVSDNDHVVANTLKVGYTDALVSANDHVVANTAKVGAITGTATGQMQYWNGTAWVIVAVGTTGQRLTNLNGVPIWIDNDTNIDPTSGLMWQDITSATGKIWMDRNLGASQVATSSNDADAYGDLYQWGRAADGHESRTSSTTATLATSDTPGHGDFITNSSLADWRSSQNDNLWQGVSGTNNPCPSGYRLPTEVEWENELTSWDSNNSAGAFASPLKLPVAGYRFYSSGSLYNLGSIGYYWSSTVSGTYSKYLYFSSNAGISSLNRAHGFSVRCLKD
ncbi:FISUMP domain-containing protein [Flavivirga jejuensis]|uniref:FISUMP domain-containing protein n=1 Tax=Flavivirga jejuensis TaxID=870487 RepID=A0ABT8WUN4_9FLAO|nr:FISUMP domain-containing protein [Flavivirga jejuensis]MDO5976705.1 FISUMP domain-containing protein [Flavivirga jejuensis]